MPVLKTIVLPVDFARQSAVVAHHARLLAQASGATVVAVHAVRPFEMVAEGMDIPGTMVVEWYQTQKPLLEQQLKEFCAKHLDGIAVRQMLVEGEPATEILRVAKEVEADVILMPTHGHGAFRRFILGSVAAKVLHDSPVPVITGAHIEEPPAQTEQIRRVLVAIDLEAHSEAILKAAGDVAKDYGAELKILHVLPEPGDGMTRYMDPAWRQELVRYAEGEIARLMDETAVEGAVELVAGEPAKVARDVAAEWGADLLVIGRHRDYSLLGRLRTHAYAIVRESPCPVLSI